MLIYIYILDEVTDKETTSFVFIRRICSKSTGLPAESDAYMPGARGGATGSHSTHAHTHNLYLYSEIFTRMDNGTNMRHQSVITITSGGTQVYHCPTRDRISGPRGSIVFLDFL